MFDEKTLRTLAHDAIRAGRLPARRPERTWGGKGGGAPCAVCDLPVGPADVEFELEFAEEPGFGPAFSCRVHARCFAAWEFERQSFVAPPCGPLAVLTDASHN